jgi:tRNA(adenine34) deaminase
MDDRGEERMGTKRDVGRHSRGRRRTSRRWVKTVTTEATKTPPGLFTRDAATIARALASPRVSPKGPVSGLRMLSFFINRAGRQLSRARRAELEKAKRLMRQKMAAGRAGS